MIEATAYKSALKQTVNETLIWMCVCVCVSPTMVKDTLGGRAAAIKSE